MSAPATSRRPPRRWIEAEIATLDPLTDSAQIMRLSTTRLLPRLGGALLYNLLYCLGFLRVAGQLEGARAVDRQGSGAIHRSGDARADATVAHFTGWIHHGASSAESAAMLDRVSRIHDHWARQYQFSNETMVHTVALFTVQFEQLFELVGAPGYSEIEKRAQVAHWVAIGRGLGAHDMPETWVAMEAYLADYESSPRWFGPSAEARRSADALIAQFTGRWFPPGLRWLGKLAVVSLSQDQVLWATGLRRPPAPLRSSLRALIRLGLLCDRHLFADRRRLLDPRSLIADGR